MFAVEAGAYDRFMGRYSTRLAPGFCDFAGVRAERRVLDVGCGPGALTAELARRVGRDAVAAVDPSEPFVEAARERHPGVEVRHGRAEELPFGPDEFDGALAQLVVHFMADPVRGLGEMVRVTRPGGLVAACVWDHAGGRSPLDRFWEAVRALDPGLDDEAARAGTREGHLGELFAAAGIRDVEEGSLEVAVEHPDFEDWWEPFTLGVGPAGAYLERLDPECRERLRERCRQAFGPGPATITAHAWAARGRV